MHSRQAALGAAMALACGTAAMGQAINHDDVNLHPGYTLTEAHPAAWVPQVSGLDFMADGRLVVLTHIPANENVTGIPKKVGTLHIVGNLGAANPEEITMKQIAQELGEPMGVCVVDGKIYVTEKTQLTEFSSADGNTWTSRKVGDIPNDPAGATNFQEYPFGLLYKDGFFYTAASAAVRIGGVSFNTDPSKLIEPKRGGILKIDAKTGTSELLNGGLRAPNGLVWGPGGSMWVTDNQGSWLPSSKLIHVVPGRNYGYWNGPNGYQEKPETWPAVWLPHGEFANSPTHPVLVKKGVFADQFLIGDVAAGGVYRTFVEKVNGEYQGAAFSFSGGFSVGMQKILEFPDGSFVLGGLGRGDAKNWGWKAKKAGIQKLTPKPGILTFEMLAVRARKDGVEIEFTKPVGAEAAVAASYTVNSATMTGCALYNNCTGSMANRTPLTVSSAQLSADKKSVFLQIAGLQAKTVLTILPKGIKAGTGEELFRPAAYYTLTSLSTSSAFSGPNAIARSMGKRASELKVGLTGRGLTGRGLTVGVPFQGSHSLTLRNLRGEALMTRQAPGPLTHALDLGNSAPGVYFIEVMAGSRHAVHSFAL